MRLRKVVHKGNAFLPNSSRLSSRPMQSNTLKPIAFIRELCKHKTEEEILEAEENYRRYLQLIKRICERVEEEKPEN